MRIRILQVGLLVTLVVGIGCARTHEDTTGYAIESSAVVAGPIEDVWQATKTVLREQEYEIYTRDKRGTFVAYTPMKRKLRVFTPKRLQYTIELEEESSNETRVRVETVGQVYGVTLLTYPDWHQRPAEDDGDAQAILAAVQAKIAGAS
jgi:hypothetical protein